MRRALIPVFLLAFGSLAAASRSVWDGVYTKEQSARGKGVYLEECAKCHGENLGGGESAPGLVGTEFLQKWNGKTANDLFETIRKTMPSDDPGNLSRRQYADITAFILNTNEFPAGQKEMESTAAAMGELRIEPKK